MNVLKQYRKIDLHMHTTISDGTDTPEEIIKKISEAGICLFSVTDHDSIKGGSEVPKILTEESPSFIRGVEFSCRDEDNNKYHVLGYGYDPLIGNIEEVVAKGHGFRMEKTEARINFLKEEFGIEFPENELEDLMSLDNPGKPHIAKMLVRHGYAQDINQAIKEFIDKKRFKNVYVHPKEAIEGIISSNGIPILAHPAYGSGDDLILGDELHSRVKKLMSFGLAGLEAYYSGFTPKIQAEVLALAEKYELYITAGSDYHGKNKMVELGWTNLEDTASAPPGLGRFLEDVHIIK